MNVRLPLKKGEVSTRESRENLIAISTRFSTVPSDFANH